MAIKIRIVLEGIKSGIVVIVRRSSILLESSILPSQSLSRFHVSVEIES